MICGTVIVLLVQLHISDDGSQKYFQNLVVRHVLVAKKIYSNIFWCFVVSLAPAQ
jgi:hypothetical protein